MCGISGRVNFHKKPVTRGQIDQMILALAHRGPDDSGSFISSDRRVGLGHNRLAIIDLSPLGHQPMTYLRHSQIVFNGEIYNYQELRKSLIRYGYKFRSKSDTEVILALYDKYGTKCLQKMRGMFSFALYDSRRNILFCARDRVGKKPFKYFQCSDCFIFASELKAILTQSEVKKTPDYSAIHNYLTLQYCPSPQTGFIGIHKLEPGSYLLVDISTGQVTKERYWQLDYSHKESLSESEWTTRIISKLEESVKLRMISDVPLGAFLSGGIDSSAVVALMAKNSLQPIKTFSIGFAEQSFNELPYARMIAEKYHTDHVEFIVKPETIDILPELVRQYEEPYADSSALPTYLLSQLTRKHVTVALNGDGGDENFAGYPRYSIQKFSLLYNRLRLLNRYLAIPVVTALARQFSTTFFHRALRFAQTLDQDYAHRYINYICYFTNEMKQELYSSQMNSRTGGDDSYSLVAKKFQEANSSDKMDQTLFADIVTYLPDDLLVKVDLASMANSLECRSPFLDHEFMELAAKIPFDLKLRGFTDKKYILKKALHDLVPDQILFRPKMGFGVPISSWFKGDLNLYIKKILLSKKAQNRGIFNRYFVQKLVEDHSSTQINFSHLLWSLLTLELWFEEYFD